MGFYDELYQILNDSKEELENDESVMYKTTPTGFTNLEEIFRQKLIEKSKEKHLSFAMKSEIGYYLECYERAGRAGDGYTGQLKQEMISDARGLYFNGTILQKEVINAKSYSTGSTPIK